MGDCPHLSRRIVSMNYYFRTIRILSIPAALGLFGTPGLTQAQTSQLVELKSWWKGGTAADNAMSTNANFGTTHPTYSQYRVEGLVFPPGQPQPLDTVGLYTWYSPSRE